MSDSDGPNKRKGTKVTHLESEQKQGFPSAISNVTSIVTSQSRLGSVLSSAPHTELSLTASDAGEPPVSTLFPGASQMVGPRVLERSDAAIHDDSGSVLGLKRSYEDMARQDANEGEGSTLGKAAVTPDIHWWLHHDATAQMYTQRTPESFRTIMSGITEDERMEAARKRLARSAGPNNVATSALGAMPANPIDLTGSDRGSSTSTPQQDQESLLHRLPSELRNRIYEHIGLFGTRLDLRTLPEPALAVAFPDLKDELDSVIFSTNKLRVPVYSDFRNDDPPVMRRSNPKTKPKKFVRRFNTTHKIPGVVAITPDSWVMNVDPRFVVIKHICFRIMESEYPHKHLCDFFLNVKMTNGKLKATYLTLGYESKIHKEKMKPMSLLAATRAKSFAAQDGFDGFNWEQAQQIAASFVSAFDASSRYTEKYGKVTLN